MTCVFGNSFRYKQPPQLMGHKKKITLKATLQSQQSRLRAKEKAEHAAKLAEQKQKQPKHGAKDKGAVRPPTVPLKPTDKILLIGEGNFSFARALVIDTPSSLEHLVPANVTATSYDSEEESFSKYPDAEAIVSTIKQRGVEVLFGIDATKLHKHSILKGRRWDRIVWNFPHAGMRLIVRLYVSFTPSLVKERVSQTRIGTFYPISVSYWTFFALHHSA